MSTTPTAEDRTTSNIIPFAEDQPTIPLWPDTGRALHLGRSSTYGAAERGEIPTLKIGGRRVVPTAALRRMLQLDGGPDAA